VINGNWHPIRENKTNFVFKNITLFEKYELYMLCIKQVAVLWKITFHASPVTYLFMGILLDQFIYMYLRSKSDRANHYSYCIVSNQRDTAAATCAQQMRRGRTLSDGICSDGQIPNRISTLNLKSVKFECYT